ncbi:hypothetical protein ACFR9U_19580 [Halorientalis brevis]|uniref:Uncharacterized protein n=1 Tax=Halorientalis brevis TaxID=1126241 RepID=A0ABD6CHZ7_9EURY|nr:hypothetical protein [Halorientalis brevis]
MVEQEPAAPISSGTIRIHSCFCRLGVETTTWAKQVSAKTVRRGSGCWTRVLPPITVNRRPRFGIGLPTPILVLLAVLLLLAALALTLIDELAGLWVTGLLLGLFVHLLAELLGVAFVRSALVSAASLFTRPTAVHLPLMLLALPLLALELGLLRLLAVLLCLDVLLASLLRLLRLLILLLGLLLALMLLILLLGLLLLSLLVLLLDLSTLLSLLTVLLLSAVLLLLAALALALIDELAGLWITGLLLGLFVHLLAELLGVAFVRSALVSAATLFTRPTAVHLPLMLLALLLSVLLGLLAVLCVLLTPVLIVMWHGNRETVSSGWFANDASDGGRCHLSRKPAWPAVARL